MIASSIDFTLMDMGLGLLTVLVLVPFPPGEIRITPYTEDTLQKMWRQRGVSLYGDISFYAVNKTIQSVNPSNHIVEYLTGKNTGNGLLSIQLFLSILAVNTTSGEASPCFSGNSQSLYRKALLQQLTSLYEVDGFLQTES